ncbi:tomoregulin-1 isoform X3 [Erythrolamprus reginae]|uniref:tomoregulin-1 isoform X3 n=1 Tax=Erythrolamprus reginae TaxID=121349 RepID=UPI00396CD624
MAAAARPRTSPGSNDAVFLMLAVALCTLGPVRTSNPLSPAAAPAADCAGKGKAGGNCSELNVKELDEKVCDESSCKYGGVCKEEGESWKCVCQLQCHTNYIPVCGSNGDTYQNECFLRRAACKHQKDITVVARGSCYSDNGSGSGEGEYEGSGTDIHRKHSKCGVCKYRAECDEDAENVGCVCNIDCSGYSFNPVCASDGSSYNNPCFVREASCLRQEQIDIRHLGHCSGNYSRPTRNQEQIDWDLPGFPSQASAAAAPQGSSHGGAGQSHPEEPSSSVDTQVLQDPRRSERAPRRPARLDEFITYLSE